jgi:hypothetical protein
MFALGLAVASCTVTVNAQSQTAAQGESILIATAGARSLYEITRDRALTLPRWDPARSPEPPLSLGSARKAAESWLEAQNPLSKAFNLTGTGLFRFFGDGIENCGPAGCWYYRLTFEPVLEGVALSDRAEIVVVVLLDESIVWPRGELPLVASAPPPVPIRRAPRLRSPTRANRAGVSPRRCRTRTASTASATASGRHACSAWSGPSTPARRCAPGLRATSRSNVS